LKILFPFQTCVIDILPEKDKKGYFKNNCILIPLAINLPDTTDIKIGVLIYDTGYKKNNLFHGKCQQIPWAETGA